MAKRLTLVERVCNARLAVPGGWQHRLGARSLELRQHDVGDPVQRAVIEEQGLGHGKPERLLQPATKLHRPE